MAGSLGTIKGQMILDVKQALAAYTAARTAHLATMTALSTGGAALIGAGAAVAGVGIAIGAGLMVAVNAASEFERKLDYFGAVSGSTAAEMDAIREKALQLGQDTIYSAGQIADSFVELGKAGVPAKDIIAGIGEGVAALGAAADLPLDTAANILMSAVQTFGLSADHAVGVADKLAGAANASIVEVQDLGLSLKYAGGVASGLGVSFDDTLTALGLLGQYGIRGSTAGTSLRQVLVSLTGTTKKATNRLTELGIITADGTNQFFNADGSAKSLAESFQILQDATKGMSDEAKLAAFKDIFQTRALPAVIALTKEGAAGFDLMAEAIGKTTAAEVAGKRLDNLSGDIEILRGNIETLAIQNGSVLQEFFRGLVQWTTSLVQAFANLSPETQALIVKIAAITAVVLTVIGTLGVFAGTILNLINLFMKLGPVFTLLKTGVTLLAGGFRALTVAMLTNPVGLIIAGVIALIAAFVLLWNNCEGFRNFWIGLWDIIKSAAMAVWNWFGTIPAFFSNIWNSITSGVTTAWNGIITFFTNIWTTLQSFFSQWGPLILAVLVPFIGIPLMIIQHWDQIVAFFSALPGIIGEFLAQLPERIGYIIGWLIGTAVKLLIEFGTSAWDVITTAWNNILTFFAELPGKIANFFQEMYDKVTMWLAKMLAKAILWAVDTYNNIVNWIQQLPVRIAEFFSNIYNNIVNWLGKARDNASTTAQNLVTRVIEFFATLPGKVAQWFSNTVDRIRETFSKAVDRAKEIASNIYNGVNDAIQGLPGLASGIFNRVVDAIKGLVRRAFNAVKDFASGLWEGFKDGLGIHSPSYIERAMWQITGVLDDETQNLKGQVRAVQGLGNRLVDIGNDTSAGFNLNLAQGVEDLQNAMLGAEAFNQALANAASSSQIGLSTPLMASIAAAQQPTVIVEAGDQIDLDVTWQAASNDEVTTRQQAKDLLGKALTTVSDTVGATS